jgi:hypothetical protein
MKCGEKLNADGTVNNNNVEQAYSYTLRGGGVETFTFSYGYDGYRYLQINAPAGVTILSVVGKTANTDVSSTGDFTSSSDLLNRYHQAMRASILSNLDSIPTDTRASATSRMRTADDRTERATRASRPRRACASTGAQSRRGGTPCSMRTRRACRCAAGCTPRSRGTSRNSEP